MYFRQMTATLLERSGKQPVVTLTGPRQSGKTTLCRETFPDKPYANLERPDTREFARSDPLGFLRQFPDGAVLDEIQRAPELLSWIQVEVDENPAPGRFILTGSQQLELSRSVGQSLAGRTALLRLLPLSIAELPPGRGEMEVDRLLHLGGYPRIHRDGLDPAAALGDYFETYVQRDLRELVQIRNLSLFEKFVRLAAGRTGQILNLQALAADVGISGHTAREWMTLLEASFVVFLLPPWFANIGKRLVKSPKIYFCDVGLAAWLIGITAREHLAAHPLRGNLFENLMVLEVLKQRFNAGLRSNLFFYRDSNGNEVDLLMEQGNTLTLVEIKAAQTVASDALRPLERVRAVLGERVAGAALIYGGNERQRRTALDVTPYSGVDEWLRERGGA